MDGVPIGRVGLVLRLGLRSGYRLGYRLNFGMAAFELSRMRPRGLVEGGGDLDQGLAADTHESAVFEDAGFEDDGVFTEVFLDLGELGHGSAAVDFGGWVGHGGRVCGGAVRENARGGAVGSSIGFGGEFLESREGRISR